MLTPEALTLLARLQRTRRPQGWQRVHDGVVTAAKGTPVTPEHVLRVEAEELAKVRAAVGGEAFACGRYAEAIEPFESAVLADDFVDVLALPAYGRLP